MTVQKWDLVVIGSGGAAWGLIDELSKNGYRGKMVCITGDKDGFYLRPLLPYLVLDPDKRPSLFPAVPEELVLVFDFVTAVDPDRPAVTCRSGARHEGSALFLALGASHPQPPFEAQTIALETLADADRIINLIPGWRRIAVAGFTLQAIEWCRLAVSAGLEIDLYPMGGEDLFIEDLFQSDREGIFSFLRAEGVGIVESPAGSQSSPASIPAEKYQAVVNALPRRPLVSPLPPDRVTNGYLTVDSALKGPVPGWWGGGDLVSLSLDLAYAPIPSSGWSYAVAQGRMAAVNLMGGNEKWSSAREESLPRLYGEDLLSRWKNGGADRT